MCVRNPRDQIRNCVAIPRSMKDYKKGGRRESFPKNKNKSKANISNVMDYRNEDTYEDENLYEDENPYENPYENTYITGDGYGYDYDYDYNYEYDYSGFTFDNVNIKNTSANIYNTIWSVREDKDKDSYLIIDDLSNEQIIKKDLEYDVNYHIEPFNYDNICQYKREYRIIADWWHNVRWYLIYIYARIHILRDYIIYNPAGIALELKTALAAFDTATIENSNRRQARQYLFKMLKLHLPFTDINTDKPIILTKPRFVYKKQVVPTFNITEFPTLQ